MSPLTGQFYTLKKRKNKTKQKNKNKTNKKNGSLTEYVIYPKILFYLFIFFYEDPEFLIKQLQLYKNTVLQNELCLQPFNSEWTQTAHKYSSVPPEYSVSQYVCSCSV